ncbi:MAG: DUF1289 domain-containing protein [Methylobacteriaceae bacterium]|nr:DUF1289 domain-containing protein [Methylobacteriaceae bacterium]
MPAPSTPCLNICVIEPSTGLCIGCGRTTAEIAQWPLLSEPERLAIMATLGERLRALTARPRRRSAGDDITARRILPSSRRRG